MRRALLVPTALALAAAVLAGCGSGDADPNATASPTAGGAEAAAPSPVDLPEGVAATVGDTEIPADQVEQRVAALAAQTAATETAPATPTEGVAPEQREAALTAQVLGDLIVGHVILDGAEELGVAPTDDDVAELRQQVVEGAGGEEAFMEQAAQIGYDEATIDRELRVLAAFQNLTEALVEEDGGDGSATPPADEQAVQQWLLEELEATDIAVDEAYGVWDPASGQVLPVG